MWRPARPTDGRAHRAGPDGWARLRPAPAQPVCRAARRQPAPGRPRVVRPHGAGGAGRPGRLLAVEASDPHRAARRRRPAAGAAGVRARAGGRCRSGTARCGSVGGARCGRGCGCRRCRRRWPTSGAAACAQRRAPTGGRPQAAALALAAWTILITNAPSALRCAGKARASSSGGKATGWSISGGAAERPPGTHPVRGVRQAAGDAAAPLAAAGWRLGRSRPLVGAGGPGGARPRHQSGLRRRAVGRVNEQTGLNL